MWRPSLIPDLSRIEKLYVEVPRDETPHYLRILQVWAEGNHMLINRGGTARAFRSFGDSGMGNGGPPLPLVGPWL